MRRDLFQDAGKNSPLQVFQSRFRRLDQPGATVGFGEEAIVIMLATHSPKIREPLRLARIKIEPVGERPDRFDRRNFPGFRRGDRLHFRRFRHPALNGKFQAFVSEKANDIAAAGAGLPGECFDVPERKGLQPPVASAKHAGRPRQDAIGLRLAGQKASCERTEEGRVRHKKSMAEMLQRVPLCVRELRGAQSNSRARNVSYSQSPGVSPERFSANRLGAFPPSREMIAG